MTEDQLEQEALGWLIDVGWQHRYGPDLAPDGPAPGRDNYRQVVLTSRLRQTVVLLNPNVPAAARDDAIRQVLDLGTPVLLAANRQFQRPSIAEKGSGLGQRGQCSSEILTNRPEVSPC